MPLSRSALGRWADRHRPAYEAGLRQLVEVPSVSADPARREAMARVAETAADLIRGAGGEASVVPTAGHPLVHGRVGGPPAPLVTVYGHLDVEPASRLEEPWESEPFALVQRGDRYFGRGTTDDKGPVLAMLLGAAAARDAGVPVNVRFLWEGEEEIGSPHFAAFLASLDLEPALVVVSDTAWLAPDRPASTAGLRGFVGFQFRLRTAASDRHSGDVGGAARNPVAEIAGLLSALHDAATGEVRVPGFHEDVIPPTPQELAGFLRSGFDVGRFRADNELWSLRTEDPLEVTRRIWARPTFEVHGIRGGYSGPGLKAIVPGWAEAVVSCRLVPDQRPERIARLVESFARQLLPDVEVEVLATAPPFTGDSRGPAAEMLRDAVRFGFGRDLVFVRDGGTIGPVTALSERFHCPVLFLALSLPSHGYHAPNENFDWPQARGGILCFARLLESAALGSATLRRPAARRTLPRQAVSAAQGVSRGRKIGPGALRRD